MLSDTAWRGITSVIRKHGWNNKICTVFIISHKYSCALQVSSTLYGSCLTVVLWDCKKLTSPVQDSISYYSNKLVDLNFLQA